MTDSPRRQVPVLDAEYTMTNFVVTVARGNVLLLAPTGEAWFLPPRSDELLIAAIREARAAVEREPPLA